jgi:quercetin dioxygenase-like cupin family protein
MTLRSRLYAALAAGLCALSLTAGAAAQQHEAVSADAVNWGLAPRFLPRGAQAAVLVGDPGKPGPFVLRLKFPAGYVIPPHRHSKEEHVTVISGAFTFGLGEKLDRAAKAFPPGSFVRIPSNVVHWAFAAGETVVQINGVGPFDIGYAKPGDDPQTKTKTQ